MVATIQIRNLPDEVHRTLKVRAAEARMTLSDYRLKEFERVARIPTDAELRQRAKALWGTDNPPEHLTD